MSNKNKNNQSKQETPAVSTRDKLVALQHITNELLSGRQALASKLGKQFGGDRDLYTSCGYTKSPLFQDYLNRYIRQDIAKRVVNAFPDATWHGRPEVYDTVDEKALSPFEQAWTDLVKDNKIYHYLHRVDRLCGIGEYAIIFFGFDDGLPPDQPLQRKEGMKLLFLQPYSQLSAEITTWVTDTNDPRFGDPLIYTVSAKRDNASTSGNTSFNIHYSRILHVAENLLENNIFGSPRLEAVLNRLYDLEKILGGSAEMFWLGGFPGYQFDIDPTLDLSGDTDMLEKMRTSIESYMHSLQRWIRTQGVEVKQLQPTVSDPSMHIIAQIQMISSATGIPQRILMGSERGQLASTQDGDNWNERVEERRVSFGEEVILRPLIERLVTAGVLPEPENDNFDIFWPDLQDDDEERNSRISMNRMAALRTYIESGAQDIYPPEVFLANELGLSQSEIEDIMSEYVQGVQDELDQIRQERDQLLKEKQTQPHTIPPQGGGGSDGTGTGSPSSFPPSEE